VDLNSLDTRLDEVNAAYDGQPLLASHPVYQYLSRRCDWNLKSLHWEPDTLPEEQQWQELGQLLASHPAKWMIWEDEPRNEIRDRLAQIDVKCVVVDPCGNRPDQGDYLEAMNRNLDNLQSLISSRKSDSANQTSAAEDPKSSG
jgi:zinc transport system substrate-binding protein